MSNISNTWNALFNKIMDNNNHNDYHYDYHNHNNYDLKLDDLYGLENKRIDYRHLKIYSIDPPNCTDADDAFSIYKEGDNIHLLIHIADPTSYFNPNDKLFETIINNGCTVYLSNRPPKHLFPDNILEKSTLTNGIKNVVTVHTILKPTYKPSNMNMFEIIKTTIEYGIIDCDNGKRFTYDEAAKNMYEDITLYLAVDIGKFFYSKRSNNLNNDFIFSNLMFTIPVVINNEVVLIPDTKEVSIMKAMIGEFAIHANTIFANGLDDDNLFLRTLVLPNNLLNNVSNHNLIHDLIKEGISANYMSDKLKHDLIGSYYTHSTSPLRRASDCIVHFLLKAKYLQIETPFNDIQLKTFADKLNKINKDMKNLQFKDIKLRTFQWIAEELECRLNSIKMKVKFISFKVPFVNLIIIGIDNMDVNIPYTIKRKKMKIDDAKLVYNIFDINITKINCYDKYDEGTLPELDELF